MRPLRIKKRQGGYSLMELGFVLLLVGMLGYYIVDDYVSNNEKVGIKREIDGVFKVISESMAVYSAEPDFSTANIDYMRQNGVFPQWMISGTQVTNSAHGVIAVVPSTIASPNDALLFTMPNYNQSMCQKVVRRIEAGVRTLAVNGKDVKPLDGPLDGKLLGANCQSGPNTITFQISK